MNKKINLIPFNNTRKNNDKRYINNLSNIKNNQKSGLSVHNSKGSFSINNNEISKDIINDDKEIELNKYKNEINDIISNYKNKQSAKKANLLNKYGLSHELSYNCQKNEDNSAFILSNNLNILDSINNSIQNIQDDNNTKEKNKYLEEDNKINIEINKDDAKKNLMEKINEINKEIINNIKSYFNSNEDDNIKNNKYIHKLKKNVEDDFDSEGQDEKNEGFNSQNNSFEKKLRLDKNERIEAICLTDNNKIKNNIDKDDNNSDNKIDDYKNSQNINDEKKIDNINDIKKNITTEFQSNNLNNQFFQSKNSNSNKKEKYSETNPKSSYKIDNQNQNNTNKYIFDNKRKNIPTNNTNNINFLNNFSNQTEEKEGNLDNNEYFEENFENQNNLEGQKAQSGKKFYKKKHINQKKNDIDTNLENIQNKNYIINKNNSLGIIGSQKKFKNVKINKYSLNYFCNLVGDFMAKKAFSMCLYEIANYQRKHEKTLGLRVLFRVMKKRIIFYEIKFMHRFKKITKYIKKHSKANINVNNKKYNDKTTNKVNNKNNSKNIGKFNLNTK